MSQKKIPALTPSLVATKGQAVPATEVASVQAASKRSAPLNFKVDAEFRRRFRQRAAEADLKLNELLREALTAWEEKHGSKQDSS